VNDERANARDVLCSRSGYGSVILRADDAVLKSAPSIQVRFRARSRGWRQHRRDIPARAGGCRARTSDIDASITRTRGLVACCRRVDEQAPRMRGVRARPSRLGGWARVLGVRGPRWVFRLSELNEYVAIHFSFYAC
jgi:hypothetical protein